MTYGIATLSGSSTPQKNKRQLIHNGRSKLLLKDITNDQLLIQFKETVLLKNGDNEFFEEMIPGKASINNRLCEMFFMRFETQGIETHFIHRLNMTEMAVKPVDPLPFRVIVHMAIGDDFGQRLNLDKGKFLSLPLVEYIQKLPDQSYGILNERQMISLNMIHPNEIETLNQTICRIADFLSGQFLAVGFKLFSVRLDFGRPPIHDALEYTTDYPLLLCNEMTPDVMNVLDLKTGKTYDLLGHYIYNGVEDMPYRLMAERFGILDNDGASDIRYVKSRMTEDVNI